MGDRSFITVRKDAALNPMRTASSPSSRAEPFPVHCRCYATERCLGEGRVLGPRELIRADPCETTVEPALDGARSHSAIRVVYSYFQPFLLRSATPCRLRVLLMVEGCTP